MLTATPNVGDTLISGHGRGPFLAKVTRVSGDWVWLTMLPSGVPSRPLLVDSFRLRVEVMLNHGSGWRQHVPPPKIGEPIKPRKWAKCAEAVDMSCG